MENRKVEDLKNLLETLKIEYKQAKLNNSDDIDYLQLLKKHDKDFKKILIKLKECKKNG